MTLNTVPPDYYVQIDDGSLLKVPLAKYRLEPGTHTFKFYCEGRLAKSREVTLKAGEPRFLIWDCRTQQWERE